MWLRIICGANHFDSLCKRNLDVLFIKRIVENPESKLLNLVSLILTTVGDLNCLCVKRSLVGILDSLENETGRQTPDLISPRIATAACKAAVKGNQALSPLEANQLIDELLGLENPYHCPHGRPTIVSMTKYELEKKFKRIV
mgnify:CR=1 FL=1